MLAADGLKALGWFAILATADACARGGEAAASSTGEAENACVRALAPGDVAGLLGAKGVAMHSSQANPEACMFESPDGRSIVVSVRLGEEVDPYWKLAMDRNRQAMAPMPGFGDAALRLRDGREVLVRKGRLSCQVDARLPQSAIGDDGRRLARRLAQLCSRVFAARRA